MCGVNPSKVELHMTAGSIIISSAVSVAPNGPTAAQISAAMADGATQLLDAAKSVPAVLNKATGELSVAELSKPVVLEAEATGELSVVELSKPVVREAEVTAPSNAACYSNSTADAPVENDFAAQTTVDDHPQEVRGINASMQYDTLAGDLADAIDLGRHAENAGEHADLKPGTFSDLAVASTYELEGPSTSLEDTGARDTVGSAGAPVYSDLAVSEGGVQMNATAPAAVNGEDFVRSMPRASATEAVGCIDTLEVSSSPTKDVEEVVLQPQANHEGGEHFDVSSLPMSIAGMSTVEEFSFSMPEPHSQVDAEMPAAAVLVGNVEQDAPVLPCTEFAMAKATGIKSSIKGESRPTSAASLRHVSFTDMACDHDNDHVGSVNLASKCEELLGDRLARAARKADVLQVTQALQARADPNYVDARGRSALHVAADKGHVEVVQALCRADAAKDLAPEGGSTPLWIASRHGHADVVRALCAVGAAKDQPADNGTSPLWTASQMGHTEVVRVLLDAGAALDQAAQSGATPLWIASKQGHEEVARLLISAGAATNRASNNGTAPLYVAAKEGHVHLVRLLCEAGVDKDQRTLTNATPLIAASREGHLEVVQLLCSYGASTDHTAQNGTTPLWLAAKEGLLDIVRVLCEAGASKDKKEANGTSPLWIASRQGHLEVVRYLCEAGASKGQKAVNGSTPFIIASQKEHMQVASLLKEFIMDPL
eukprot:gnl/TRDRNA2_/TRDRNA2_175467_c7_seq1.p1 gnl/TRDRNA2_/TRDRNA2_175467_c7~~gnl/TRDRNA2_/TRDRNA2_175467_c7_seq1.p1  ORF type:complete len:714 (+),score=137.65 gnl/TRDRNA2_/TRDRNA2_175467_c7_seq1:165-2306(+)